MHKTLQVYRMVGPIGYILYLRNISFSSVSGRILTRRSLSAQFGSVRFAERYGLCFGSFGSIPISTPFVLVQIFYYLYCKIMNELIKRNKIKDIVSKAGSYCKQQ